MWNKTSWLSVDLSAAVALCSAPENHAAERQPRSKPRQSLTSGKVTHRISFSLSISDDAASFFFQSPQRRQALRSLFSVPRSQFFKRKLRQECLHLLPRERNWSSDATCSPARDQNTHRMIQIKVSQRVLREGDFCYSGDAVMPHL